MSTPLPSTDAALGPREGWLSTFSTGSHPHMVPIWFVVDDSRCVWISTGLDSAKVRNIRANPHVSFAVPSDGESYGDAVAHGTAEILSEAPDAVLDKFEAKYTWRPSPESDTEMGQMVFIKIAFSRWVMGNSKRIG